MRAARRPGQRLPLLALVIAVLGAGCAEGNIGDPSVGAADASPPEDTPDGANSIQDSPDAEPATTPDAAPDAPLPCDGGDVQVVGPNGHCYMRFSSATATWQGASDICTLIGAYLATSTTAEEDQLLEDLAGNADAWLGGNDLAAEMTWVWVTAEPMTYTNWGSGEPNNAGGNGNDENCMIMRKVGISQDPNYNVGTWDDRNCGHRYTFICERP